MSTLQTDIAIIGSEFGACALHWRPPLTGHVIGAESIVETGASRVCGRGCCELAGDHGELGNRALLAAFCIARGESPRVVRNRPALPEDFQRLVTDQGIETRGGAHGTVNCEVNDDEATHANRDFGLVRRNESR